MTAEHSTRVFEDGGFGEGWTAACTACNWEGTERVHRDVAQQEADLHTAVKAGLTTPCCASDAHLPDDDLPADFAVCPACGLMVEVIHYGRYAPHSMIVDGLEGWEETLRAAQEAGVQAVRRLNERAKRQAQQARIRVNCPPSTASRRSRHRERPDREPCINGGDTHARESVGLDINAKGVLVNVRRCVWCRMQEEKPYGSGSRRAWTRSRVGEDAYCDLTDTIDPGDDDQ